MVGDNDVVKTHNRHPYLSIDLPFRLRTAYQSPHIVNRWATDSRYEQGGFTAPVGNGER